MSSPSSSSSSSSKKKYDLDLAYQKEPVVSYETRAFRYPPDMSRMAAGRNFNQIFEQSMRFDDADDDGREDDGGHQRQSSKATGAATVASGEGHGGQGGAPMVQDGSSGNLGTTRTATGAGGGGVKKS